MSDPAVRTWRTPSAARAIAPGTALAVAALFAAGRLTGLYLVIALIVTLEIAVIYGRPRATLLSERLDLRSVLRSRSIPLSELAVVRARRRGLEFEDIKGRRFYVLWVVGDVGLFTQPAARRAATEKLAAEVLAAVRDATAPGVAPG